MKKIIAIVLALLLLAGCGGQQEENKTVSVDVQELYAQLEAVGMPEMLPLDPSLQLNLYGIREEDVRQSKVVVCSDGLRADEIWLVEAVDAETANTIKSLAENRVRQKDAESVTYSPEQNVIVKKSIVTVNGNYVIFLCSPDVETMKGIVDAAFAK